MLRDVLSRIQERLSAVNLSESAAARQAKLSPDAIRNMRRSIEAGKESAGVSTRTLSALAPVLQTTVAWLSDGIEADDSPMVMIRGLAGAGPEGTVLFATGDGNFGEVPAPVGASPTTEALEVRGESMHGLANDGWLIFYEDKEPPTEEHMGEPCVCWLEDDRVLVKIPQPGSQPGLFHLESTNAPTMRDVPVRYFSLVTDIKTRAAARRFIRRNPDHPVQDVKIAS